MDLFKPQMADTDINGISSLGLAHLGDAVFELMVRTRIITGGGLTHTNLHAATVKLVCAPAQAEAISRVLDSLSPEELAVYKRGRNTKVNSVPQHAGIAQYHAATGLETLFGWLYLHGRTARLEELFESMMEGK